MKNYLPAFESAPLFQGMTGAEILSVLQCLGARPAAFAKSEFLLRAGEPAPAMGLLAEGSALILQEDFWGNRNLIARVQAGQLFAESYASLPGSILQVSVLSDSPCVVMWLNVGRVFTPCASACPFHARLIRNLLTVLSEKNRFLNEKLTHMGQRTTREKLMSYLSSQATIKNASEFTIPYSRQQLADYLSVERSAMSAELGKLKKEGVIDFNKNRFCLLTKSTGSHRAPASALLEGRDGAGFLKICGFSGRDPDG